MNKDQLFEQIKKKKSFLCVGLDPEINKMPKHIAEGPFPLFTFNAAIIDATERFAVAFKPNLAFYEAYGILGWQQLEMTAKYIKEKYPDIFTIADAKRGDIGNTSKMYAKAFFETMGVDALTVAPYMGKDSIIPFLEYTNKWSVIFNLTSNAGSEDLQTFHIKENGLLVYEHMLKKAVHEWGADEQHAMFVVGATKAESLQFIRDIIPNHFLLIPGVGAQGGSLYEVAKYGLNKQCGLLVNNSRGIIYASNGKDFAEVAGEKAKENQQDMEKILIENKLIAV